MSDEQIRVNPYAASDAAILNSADEAEPMQDGSGPPWEQPGPWPKRFFETMWLTYRQPNSLFGEMRRQGSWWMPLGYVVVSATLYSLTLGLMHFGANSANIGLFVVQSWAMSLLNVPFVAFLAATMQVLLAMTGPRQSFRATLRCAYYAVGSCFVVGLLGTIGPWLSIVVLIVLQVIAIRAVHRISELRAILVVLGAWIMFFIAGIVVVAVAVEFNVITLPN